MSDKISNSSNLQIWQDCIYLVNISISLTYLETLQLLQEPFSWS